MSKTRPDWYYRQSAVIPYHRAADGLEVLLITSRKGRRWVLPKGVVEPYLTPPQSAAQEALEEAGIKGEVDERALGFYQYKKWGGICEVQVFAMAVTDELDTWPEAGFRRREWLPVAEAKERLAEADLRALLDALPRAASTGTPSSGASRHLLPAGEKGRKSPSPQGGEGLG